jgi:hypothetical protein
MDLPRNVIIPQKWEVKLGWSAEHRAWAVMILVDTAPGTTLSIAFHPDQSAVLGKALIDGAKMAKTEPPHPIGFQH